MPRPPATLLESVTANFRPQPAIPAALVLMLALMFAMSLGTGHDGSGDPTTDTWIVVAGLVASCGLAIAAGFCSFFPPLAWLGVALLARDVIRHVPGSALAEAALVACAGASVVMLAAQAWRVRTGRFVPTISDSLDAGPDAGNG